MELLNNKKVNGDSKERVIFSCFLGSITKERVLLSLPNEREILLDEIAFVELKKHRILAYNYFIGFIGTIMILIAYFNFSIYFFVPGSILISSSLFINIKKSYISIVLRIPTIIVIKLKSKEEKKGQIFVKMINKQFLYNKCYIPN